MMIKVPDFLTRFLSPGPSKPFGGVFEMNGRYPHPSLEFLSNATAFACFARIWWDGAGIDSVVWYTDVQGGYRRVSKTGQTDVVIPPKIVGHIAITEGDVEQVIRQFEDAGVRDLRSQTERFTTAHCDHWYGVKKQGEINAYWLQIAAMLHEDPKGIELAMALGELLPPEF